MTGTTMGTRIIFDGHEYASAEAMPAGVRQGYELAMAQFADADRNGIPDLMERGAAGNVIIIKQSSVTINGRTLGSVGEMPEPMRRLFEQAMAQLGANASGVPGAPSAPAVDAPTHRRPTARMAANARCRQAATSS